MRVGAVAERKDGEDRVGLTPEGAYGLVHHGHQVLVEHGAGEASGYGDAEYAAAGANVAVSAAQVWNDSDLVVKVKEPIESEFALFRPGGALFTYLHLATAEALTRQLREARVTALAYELIARPDGSMPLLSPMSEIAGRMAAEVGVQLLRRPGPGRGKLIGGVPGIPPGRAVVVGSGRVGTAAARVLMGLDAAVTVVSNDLSRLGYLQEHFGSQLATRMSSPHALAEELVGADLAILAVLAPGGAAAPRLVTRQMVRSMGAGAVLVDVSIDQGGASETSRPTTHHDPTYVEEGVVHYCVTNMPGAVPQTSTRALTNASYPYVVALADLGVEGALRADPGFARALSSINGELVEGPVADQFGLPSVANPYLGGER